MGNRLYFLKKLTMKTGGPVISDRVLSRNQGGSDLERQIDQALLAFYLPACIVMSKHLRVLERRGNLAPFGLPHRFGKIPSGILGDALRRGVEAASQKEAAYTEEIPELARVTVVPLATAARKKRLFLVVFQIPDQNGADRIRELESQLTTARMYLASAVDDYEATTEELHSAHEELQCANEELQQLNQELNAANENLSRLNVALEGRSRELQRVNSELSTLLSSVGIPMLMLGPDLRVRRFNLQAERFFNLQASDIGKPIREVHPSVSLPHLEEACLDVLDTFSARSRQIQDPQGRNLSLLFRPYRTPENKIDGVILALIDSPARAFSTG